MTTMTTQTWTKTEWPGGSIWNSQAGTIRATRMLGKSWLVTATSPESSFGAWFSEDCFGAAETMRVVRSVMRRMRRGD